MYPIIKPYYNKHQNYIFTVKTFSLNIQMVIGKPEIIIPDLYHFLEYIILIILMYSCTTINIIQKNYLLVFFFNK